MISEKMKKKAKVLHLNSSYNIEEAIDSKIQIRITTNLSCLRSQNFRIRAERTHQQQSEATLDRAVVMVLPRLAREIKIKWPKTRKMCP